MSGEQATSAEHKHATLQDHQKFADALGSVYSKGGLLQQAREAKAAGDGVFLQFLKQILAQYGPLLGQLLISLLGGLIHIPLPVAPVNPPKVPPVTPLAEDPASPTNPPSHTVDDPQSATSQNRQHPSCG